MGKKVGMIFSAAIGVFATIIVAASKGLLEDKSVGDLSVIEVDSEPKVIEK